MYVDPAAAVPVKVAVEEPPAQIVAGLKVNVDVGAELTAIVCVVIDEQDPEVIVRLTV